jgi:hypothetical protein
MAPDSVIVSWNFFLLQIQAVDDRATTWVVAAHSDMISYFITDRGELVFIGAFL